MKALADRRSHRPHGQRYRRNLPVLRTRSRFEKEIFEGSDGQPRYALRFGKQKINLQDRATDTANKAQVPTFGSGDFCLIAAVPLQQVLAHLRAENIAIVAGPVTRKGAMGPMRSLYFRDPDGNLIEVSEYTAQTAGTHA